MKLLAEGKQSRGDGAKPALGEQHCPGPASIWATAAEQVTQAGSAVPWLCLAHGEGSLQTQCQVLTCWGEASQPLGESQEPSAPPQGYFGFYPWIEFLLNGGTCPR